MDAVAAPDAGNSGSGGGVDVGKSVSIATATATVTAAMTTTTAETAAVAATQTAAAAMATATASDEGDGNGDGDGGGCLGVLSLLISLYGKVRYIGALRTAHYALRPPQVRVLLQLWTDSARCRAEAVFARPR